MIKEAIDQLLALPEECFDLYLFSQDPIKGKVSKEERVEIIKKSRQCGVEVSQRLKSHYGDRSVDDYIDLLGVDVTYKESNTGLEYIYFGTFQKPDQMTIYTDNIQKGQALAEEESIERLQHSDFQAIVKAHELFHYFEESDPDLYVNTHKITLWTFLGYTHKSTLVAQSEIASMAFAKDLLGLEFPPHILDVLLLYPHNQDQAKIVYDRIMEQQEEMKENT